LPLSRERFLYGKHTRAQSTLQKKKKKKR